MQYRRALAGGNSLIPPEAIVSGSNAKALDVVFSSEDGERLAIVRGQENWPEDGWTPIGIVAIPGSHNRYGDNTCGVMAIRGMSRYTPEDGSVTDREELAFESNSSYSSSDYMGNTVVAYYDSSTPKETIVLPRQTSSETLSCSGGSKAWPYKGANTEEPASTELTIHEYNYPAIYDYNGLRNTVLVYDQNKNGPDWTTSRMENAITYGAGVPAFTCCSRFKTVGTKSLVDIYQGRTSSINHKKVGTPESSVENTGYWYYPSAGEMCYLPRYRFEFNKIIAALNNKYGSVGVEMIVDETYDSRFGSSTKAAENSDDSKHWVLDMSNGYLEKRSTLPWYVVAFMRL